MPETWKRPDSETSQKPDCETWERPDLREELIKRLRDPETRQHIADALITEASGGPPDLKSGQPKGGATVIRAFELIREIALERPENSVAAAWNLSAYTDAELTVMLARLESNSAETSRNAAESWDGVPGQWDGTAPESRRGAEKSGPAQEARDGAEKSGPAQKSRDDSEKSRSPPESRRGGARSEAYA